MSNIVWVSVSQISTFRSCRRKWAGQKLFRLPEPPRAAATMGTEVHAELEARAKDPAYVFKKHEALATAMWRHVPSLRGAEVIPEARLELPVLDGVMLLGFADLLIKYPASQAGVILDYKTTKSKRYIKSRKTLEAGDLQAAVYQKYGMVTEPDYNWTCQWVTGLTDGTNKVVASTAKLANETINSVWSEVQRDSADIVQLRASAPKNFEDVEPTFGDACKAFGGCPFINQCHMAVEKEQEKNMADKSALLAKIAAARKNKAAAAEAKATPAPEPVEGPTPEPEVDPINPPEAEKVVEKAELTEEEAKPKAKAKTKKTKPKADPAPAVIAPSTDGLTIYVDCFPMKGAEQPMLLSDIIYTAARNVCETAGVPHWSLADYGTGKGGLAVEFEKVAPQSGAVYLSSYTEEGKVLLPVLERIASVVVKG